MRPVIVVLVVVMLMLTACTSPQIEITKNKQQTAAIEPAYTGELLAGNISQYRAFTQIDYTKALKEKKKIVLNFYADWCGVCHAEQPEIVAAFNELHDPDVIGFRVNYKDSDTDDAEVALAKKFGITYQHTKVLLKNGQRVLKAPDSWSKERYLAEVGKL